MLRIQLYMKKWKKWDYAMMCQRQHSLVLGDKKVLPMLTTALSQAGRMEEPVELTLQQAQRTNRLAA